MQKFLMLLFKELVNYTTGGSVEQHLYGCPNYGVLFRVPKYGYGFSVYGILTFIRVSASSLVRPFLPIILPFIRWSSFGVVATSERSITFEHKHIIFKDSKGFFGLKPLPMALRVSRILNSFNGSSSQVTSIFPLSLSISS